MRKTMLILMMLLSITTVHATEDTLDQELNELLVNSQIALMNQEGKYTFDIQLNIDGSAFGVYVDNDNMTIKEGDVKEPYMVIDTTEKDLAEVNDLLSSYNDDGKLSFMEKLSLWKLMLEYNLSNNVTTIVENEVSAQMVLW